ncbi:unnamed protein product [Phytophthora lilii]|uniref:Unnamed protein product n=1 Tax=Phytophthora lilii TaxID=2077276 RepID=A0A9W6TIR9_9STRA|nr:unnamed protein product [Phytophthora lilii]
MDAHGVATGEIEVNVQSPMDKARRVAELRAMHAEVQPTVVFVGDSTNDLLALLEADVGVWLAPDMTSSSSALLQQLVDLYGIDVLPLTNYSTLADSICAASDKHQGDYKPTFFTTTDWSHLRTIVRAQVQNGHT